MEAGGVQRVAYLLKKELDNRRYDSTIWFLYTKRPAYAGVSGIHSLMDHPPSPLDYLKIIIRLARMIHREKPDVLITHTYYSNVLGHILSTALGVRSRVAVQHNPVHSYPRAARIADSLVGSIGVYTANVAVSQTVAESLARYPRSYRDRIEVVYNGVPSPPEPAPRDVTRLDAAVLVNVGRFSEQKNQSFLIRLLASNKDLHLLLVGDGELREQLHNLPVQLNIQDRVHFTGEVSPDEVASLISCSDVFVLPSLFEAVGLVVLEAMVLGKPVVSNDIPSSREFIGNDGVIVDIAFPGKWLTSIQNLLDRPEIASERVARAMEKARRFTVPRMADGYESTMLPVGPRSLVRSDD
jgi:glycosyltransferase involved in cell wall biosynthesis